MDHTTDWLQAADLTKVSLFSRVSLGKFINLFDVQFPHLENK